MRKLLRNLLKITLLPVILTLNIFLYLAKGILYVVGGMMGLLAIICLVAVMVGIFNNMYSFMVLPALISAYLLSPIGLPLIAVFITAHIELFRDWIKAF